jgi:polar amino acid transport system substrate-binding protein
MSISTLPEQALLRPGFLTFGACSGSGPTHVVGEDGEHSAFEGAVAQAVCRHLGLQPAWEIFEWDEMYPALADRRADAILYNQCITETRLQKADFSRPYGVFHEAVMVRDDSPIHTPADLVGASVGGIETTTCLDVAFAFDGADVRVYKSGVASFEGMIEDLREGRLDALVDDELYLAQYSAEGMRLAFAIQTANPYGIAVAKGSPLREALNEALDALEASGELQAIWAEAFPGTPFESQGRAEEPTIEKLRELVRDPANIRLLS